MKYNDPRVNPLHNSKKSSFRSLFFGFGVALASGIIFACNYDSGASPVAIDLTRGSVQSALFAEGLVSTDLNERDLAINPEGNRIIFTISNWDNTRRSLVESTYKQGRWSPPELLPFSGKHNDLEPFFSPDGTYLLFASDRPIERLEDTSNYNLWKIDLNDQNWSIPQELGPVINTDGNEYYPSVASNGNLYFTAPYEHGYGLEDIYVARLVNGTYSEPAPLDSTINTRTYEFNAFIDPDERYLLFSSYGREDGYGGGDLYISYRDENEVWSKSINLGSKINTASLDYCPFIWQNEKILYFSSNRRSQFSQDFESIEDVTNDSRRIQNGMGNIFHIAWDPYNL